MAFPHKQLGEIAQDDLCPNKIPFHIQDRHYSPQKIILKDSSKQTPKSIVRESLDSGSKFKKNITINETLNEIRDYSHRSEASDTFKERNLNKEFEDSVEDLQNKKSKCAVASSNQRYEEDNDQSEKAKLSFQVQEEKILKELRPPIYIEDKTQAPGFKEKNDLSRNVLNISKHDLSDFQKAYIKKLQREREQAKYCEIIRSSNKREAKGEIINNSLLLHQKSEKQTKKNRLNEENSPSRDKLTNQKNNLNNEIVNQRGLSQDNPNIVDMRNKIHDLETSLDVYSKRFKANIDRKKAHLGRDYKFLSDQAGSEDIQTEKTRQSVEAKNVSQSKDSYQAIMQKYNKDNTIKIKDTQSDVKRSPKNYTSNYVNAVDKQKKQYKDSYDKDAREEFEQLRNRNLYIGSESSKEDDNKVIVGPIRILNYNDTEEIFRKKQELLETINQIRVKLSKSLSNYRTENKDNKNGSPKICSKNKDQVYTIKKKSDKENKLKSQLKYNEDISNIKSHQLRKAYGAEKLKSENVNILNQGLSTTYNGFNWNTDQSLRISKNV